MAVAGSLTYSTEIDTKGIKTGLTQVESDVKKTGGIIDVALGNIVANLATTAVNGLKQITAAGIDYNATMESYETSFEVMLGSQEAAVEKMQELVDIGASTPFEATELADATQQLLAFGVSADDSTEYLLQLGDISQGSADKLGSLVLAFGKMQSSQKVTLEYLNIMIERGFNPLQLIAEETGESMSQLYDRVSEGGVAVEEVEQAIAKATSEGGQFFESMDKQSQTFSGQMSTLSDNVSIFLGEAFKPLFDFLSQTALPLLNDLLSGGKEIKEWLQENKTAVILTTIALSTFIGAIVAYNVAMNITAITTGIATAATKAFGIVMAFATSHITIIMLAIGALIMIIYLLVENWDKVSEVAKDVWEWIKKTWEDVADWFKDKVVDPIVDFFTSMWGSITSAFEAGWDFIKGVFSRGGEIFTGIAESIASIFVTAVNAIITGINWVISKPFELLNGILNFIRDIEIFDWKPFSGLWGKNPIPVPQIPKLATGGVVSRATLAMIGEDGQEAVVPLEKNTEWVGKVANLMKSAIMQDKTYNANGNVLSATNGANSNFKLEATTPIELYLDGEKVYAGQQKIAYRKQLGGNV